MDRVLLKVGGNLWKEFTKAKRYGISGKNSP
jgi:hypothetical protein